MAIDSQLKLLTDNFSVEDNEDGALNAGAYKPCFRFCHFNNMLVIRHQEQKIIIHNFNYLNSIHSNIYLAIKFEKDGHFPFLATDI
jgi:hypothetical protein